MTTTGWRDIPFPFGFRFFLFEYNSVDKIKPTHSDGLTDRYTYRLTDSDSRREIRPRGGFVYVKVRVAPLPLFRFNIYACPLYLSVLTLFVRVETQ